MITTDFANQFYQPAKTNKGPAVLFGLGVFLFSLMLLLLPSSKSIKTYLTPSTPSSYQAYLEDYLKIFSQYEDPGKLPKVYEESLKQAAQNALILSSQSKVYYPNNQKLVTLTAQIENQIESKFPEMIAQR